MGRLTRAPRLQGRSFSCRSGFGFRHSVGSTRIFDHARIRRNVKLSTNQNHFFEASGQPEKK